MNQVGSALVALVTAFIGLAIVAVIVSKNAQTPTVISSTATGLAKVIQAAVTPVTGGTGNQLQA
jgi:hypothetical protein